MREILFSLTVAATLFAPSVLAALKAIKVPVVRWPGGCFADEYHWRNGIGPAGKLALSLAPESVTVVSIE